jgi:hypothetical protein
MLQNDKYPGGGQAQARPQEIFKELKMWRRKKTRH